MSADFTTIYPEDGGEPWEAECDWCGERIELDHYYDMLEHSNAHRRENAMEVDYGHKELSETLNNTNGSKGPPWYETADDYDSASARGGVGSWQHDLEPQPDLSNQNKEWTVPTWEQLQESMAAAGAYDGGVIDNGGWPKRVDHGEAVAWIRDGTEVPEPVDWDKVYAGYHTIDNPIDPNSINTPERPNEFTTRSRVLMEADALINGYRESDYGPPSENFDRIARIWSVIFGIDVTMAQVAQAMAGVKLARLVETPDHWDTYTDLAGYAALGAELAEDDNLRASRALKGD